MENSTSLRARSDSLSVVDKSFVVVIDPWCGSRRWQNDVNTSVCTGKSVSQMSDHSFSRQLSISFVPHDNLLILYDAFVSSSRVNQMSLCPFQIDSFNVHYLDFLFTLTRPTSVPYRPYPRSILLIVHTFRPPFFNTAYSGRNDFSPTFSVTPRSTPTPPSTTSPLLCRKHENFP